MRSVLMNFKEDLTSYVRAGYPILYVTAAEPQRAIKSVQAVADEINGGTSVHTWSYTSGWDGRDAGQPVGTVNPLDVFSQVGEFAENSICILENFHIFLGKEADINFVQPLIDGYYRWKDVGSKKTVVILAPIYQLPIELERFIQTVSYEFPDATLIADLVDGMAKWYEIEWESPEERIAVINNAAGMTEDEVENSISLSIVRTNAEGTKRIDPDIIMREKAKILEKGGILSYEPYDEGMESIGGLDNLKRWLDEEKTAVLDPKAREYGIDAPKGIFLLGLPGTGKSLAAKCVSREWGLPLIHFDLSKVFGSLVGESEQNMRSALEQIEALAPAVVWIDEIDKGMAGAETSGISDSGTTTRVVGTLLTWMQERPDDKVMYMVATANSIDNLPLPLLRRFDDLFWVDLPTDEDRKKILSIHLEKRNQMTPAIKKGLQKLSDVTQGFSGAELEKAILKGMKKAFARGHKLGAKHIEESAKRMRPVAVLEREKVEVQRKWAENRCEFAQDGDQVSLATTYSDRSGKQVRSLNLN